MSLGFSVVDFLHLIECVKRAYDAVQSGPTEYKEIKHELKTLKYSIEALTEESKNPNSLLNRKGLKRKEELLHVVAGCNQTIAEFQKIADENSSLSTGRGGKATRTWHAYRVGSSDLDSLRGKLTFHASMINVFLSSLEGSALGRIEKKIDAIYARMVAEDACFDEHTSIRSTSSAASSILSQINTNEDEVWAALRADLLSDGISISQILANREEIIEYVKGLVDRPTTHSDAREGGPVADLSDETPLAPTRIQFTENSDLVPPGIEPVLATPECAGQHLPLKPVDSSTVNTLILLSKLQFGKYNGRPACMLILYMRMWDTHANSFFLPSASLSISTSTSTTTPPNTSDPEHPSSDPSYSTKSSKHLGIPLLDNSIHAIEKTHLVKSPTTDRWKIQGGGTRSSAPNPDPGSILEDRWEIAGQEKPYHFRFGVIFHHTGSPFLARIVVRFHSSIGTARLSSLKRGGGALGMRRASTSIATCQECNILSRPEAGDVDLTGSALQRFVERDHYRGAWGTPYPMQGLRSSRRTL